MVQVRSSRFSLKPFPQTLILGQEIVTGLRMITATKTWQDWKLRLVSRLAQDLDWFRLASRLLLKMELNSL